MRLPLVLSTISSSRIVQRHTLKTAVANVLYDAMFDELPLCDVDLPVLLVPYWLH